MTDTERLNWLLEYLIEHGLLRAEFCHPAPGVPAADYWVLHPPYVRDAGTVLGYAKTATGAIDSAIAKK